MSPKDSQNKKNPSNSAGFYVILKRKSWIIWHDREDTYVVILKIIFIALLCVPLLYLSFFFVGKLYDEYVKKRK